MLFHQSEEEVVVRQDEAGGVVCAVGRDDGVIGDAPIGGGKARVGLDFEDGGQGGPGQEQGVGKVGRDGQGWRADREVVTEGIHLDDVLGGLVQFCPESDVVIVGIDSGTRPIAEVAAAGAVEHVDDGDAAVDGEVGAVGGDEAKCACR